MGKMQKTTRPGFSSLGSWVLGAACVLSGPATALAVPGLFIPQADAEIREDDPENPRAAVTSGTLPTDANSGTGTELSVRVTSGQNRAAIIRFPLAGVTVADLQQGTVDLRLFSRNANLGGANAGGVKIYGLFNNAPLVNSWSESTVHYRDAGASLPVTPAGGHPVSQPPPGNPVISDPVRPVRVQDLIGNSVPPQTWGSNPNDPTRAPGLRHENPAYSAVVEQTNEQRYQNNLAIRAAYLANPTGTPVYETYINLPSYLATSSTGATDITSYDRPGATVGADVDAALGTLLGNLNYDGVANRPAGSLFSFTTAEGNSPVNMDATIQGANRAALVAYLTGLLNDGATSATFLVFQKNTIDGDTLPVRSDNLVFASKEFKPANGVAGQFAPQLVIGVPEPASLAVLGGFAALMLRRRSR